MKRQILLAAAASLLAAPLAAQQGAGRLSLEEALRLAGENNPALRTVRGELLTAHANERKSLGAFLPSLSASFSTGGAKTSTRKGTDNFGNPLESDSIIRRETSNFDQSFALSLDLFRPGRMGEVRATRAEGRATRAGVAAEEQKVMAEVERRYYAALRAEQLIALEERLLASARERLETTRALMRVAVKNPVDVLGAEVQVSDQERAVEKARGEARRTRLALHESLGELDGGDPALVSQAPALFDPAGLRADSLVSVALNGHPRIQKSTLTVDAARRRTSAARWSRLPTLSARTSLGWSGVARGYSAYTDVFSPPEEGLSVSFSLSLPIFDQFTTSASIAQARAAEVRAGEEVRSARLGVESEVRSALIDLQNAFREARGTERTLAIARERVEMAQEQYRLGSITFTEMQDAVESASKSERDALNARFEFAAALVTLEEKTGAPVRPAR